MNIELEAKRTLNRIMETQAIDGWSKAQKVLFKQRLEQHFTSVFALLFDIYGHRYDFYFYLEKLVTVLADGFTNRPQALKQKDRQRLKNPRWFLDKSMLGMACYVDLFADDLKSLIGKIPYLQELGITYLHLMPLYDSPKGDSDGGYAVSDYRKVNPEIGEIQDLEMVAQALSKGGISLVLDFVFNHTSDEHRWAKAAQEGDKDFQDFYYMFDDRSEPDRYEKTLREIFPQVRRGNFTWNDASQKWVWTTFNNFQWDLNYSNPAVFNAITSEMLFLANIGCEALRLDALAFIWKEMGTNCENQSNAHKLIKAFNACLQIVAPAVVFKSEAIVHPDEVVKYIDAKECQLSYNPLLMALIWNSLATRKTRLLTQSMRKSFSIQPDCAWVNYVRCHDDIGWTFDDDVAGQLGVNGHDHRMFLNQFFTGRFEGSFASGVAFGENPSTGDCRVCGSLASLCGLERAIDSGDKGQIDDAVNRILLVHAIILSIGGIPLLYSGDELGLLNDYSYQQQDNKSHDDRWVHRLAVTEESIFQAQHEGSIQNRVFKGLKQMIALRKHFDVFGDAETQILDSDNIHIFAFARHSFDGDNLLVVANFSEQLQTVDARLLDHCSHTNCLDLLSNQTYQLHQGTIKLKPYQVIWLISDRQES